MPATPVLHSAANVVSSPAFARCSANASRHAPLTEDLPPVGPVFGFTFGGDAPTRHFFVGAVGSQEMRDSLLEISYEVTVRFNDGRYGVVETRDGVDLRVGDPVKVINNKIELNV